MKLNSPVLKILQSLLLQARAKIKLVSHSGKIHWCWSLSVCLDIRLHCRPHAWSSLSTFI